MNTLDPSSQRERDMGSGHAEYADLAKLIGAEDSVEELNTGLLADKLRPMVTEERLAANVSNYDVMRTELSPREERQVAAIRERLLGVPLLHGTRDDEVPGIIQREGLKPHKPMAGPTDRGNTFPIDQSLGLDEYVFFNWGRIDTMNGRNFVVVDARAMLERTVVTPLDITRSKLGRDLKPLNYEELTEEERDELDQTYFGQMVSGSDWLEIQARQVLQFAQRMPEYPFPIGRHDFLGEVKVHGSLDVGLVKGTFTVPQDMADAERIMGRWSQELLRHGIMLDTTEETLRLRGRALQYEPEKLERFQAGGWGDVMGIE